MDALVFTGGEAPEPEFLAALAPRFGLYVAADSGLASALKAGLRPDWVVGDMDSLGDLSLLDGFSPERVLRYPAAKDMTDTEIAMEVAFERGARRVAIAGGGGGRLDHTLAMRALFERPRRPFEWYTGLETIYLVEAGGELRLNLGRGSLVSVFPLAGGASGMDSSGLVWPLAGLAWTAGGFGISNRCSEDYCSIKAGEGELLVIAPRSPEAPSEL